MSQKPNILYVEDDEINALIMEKLLGGYFNIQVANTGEQALELVSKAQYDLILMDINLGDEYMDGTEAMNRIKQLENYRNVKIFAVTSYAMPEDRRNFLELGFDDYFSKPVDHKALINKINSLV